MAWYQTDLKYATVEETSNLTFYVYYILSSHIVLLRIYLSAQRDKSIDADIR